MKFIATFLLLFSLVNGNLVVHHNLKKHHKQKVKANKRVNQNDKDSVPFLVNKTRGQKMEKDDDVLLEANQTSYDRLDAEKLEKQLLSSLLGKLQKDTNAEHAPHMPQWVKIPPSVDLVDVVQKWTPPVLTHSFNVDRKKALKLDLKFMFSNSKCNVQILSLAKCFTAATQLGLAQQQPIRQDRADRPSGCYYCVTEQCGVGGTLFFNEDIASLALPNENMMVLCNMEAFDDCPKQMPTWSSFKGGSSVEGYCSKISEPDHPPLNVVFYLYDESPYTRFVKYYPHITKFLLSRIPHIRVIFSNDPPLLNNTLVVFSSNPTEQGKSKVFLESYIVRLKLQNLKFGLLHLEDECTFWSELGCPYVPIGNMTKIYQFADIVFRSYFSEDYHALGHVYWIPLPPLNCQAEESFSLLEAASSEEAILQAEEQRDVPCSFAGTVHHDWAFPEFQTVQERVDFIDAFKQDAQLCPYTQTVDDYCGDMKRQILAAIPAGNNPECFRLWEALEMRGIPVLRKCDDPSRCMPLESIPLLREAPFIRVREWEKFPDVVRKYKEDKKLAARKREEVQVWYQQFKINLRIMILGNLRLFGVMPDRRSTTDFTPQVPMLRGKFLKASPNWKDCGYASAILSKAQCRKALNTFDIPISPDDPLQDGHPCYQSISTGFGRQNPLDQGIRSAVLMCVV